MRIILAGGTGFLGRGLVEELTNGGHEVVLLTRMPSRAARAGGPRVEEWDGKTLGSWAHHVDGADAVVNFAGEPIAAERWTPERKQRIVASRVDATRTLCAAIAQARKKPGVLVNASAVGYYGPVERGDVAEDHERGEGFLALTTEQWEREARKAEAQGVRVAMLRMGVVLGRGGGALEKMVLPFKLFVGGPIGSGRQWFPWVHREDVISIVLFALEHQDLAGPVNVAAPDYVTMREFCSALGTLLHRPSWVPVPAFVLRPILGEMAEMVLTGQKVVPVKLLMSGFTFQFPALKAALTDLLSSLDESRTGTRSITGRPPSVRR